MSFEGNLNSFVAACRREQHFIETGDPRFGGNDIAIFADSGLLLGIETATILRFFDWFGIVPKLFKGLVGSSTGTPPLVYWTAGQIGACMSVYYRECATRDFLNVRKLLSKVPGEHAMGADFLRDVFNGSTGKGLNRNAFWQRAPNVYALTTEWETGFSRALDLCDRILDPVVGMVASLADPVFSHGNVLVNGMRLLDGNVAKPFGISKARELTGAKHLLVVANGSEKQKLVVGRYPDVPALARLPQHLRDAITEEPVRIARELELARGTDEADCNIVIFWGDGEGSPVERNGAKIRGTGVRAVRRFAWAFHKAWEAAGLDPAFSSS